MPKYEILIKPHTQLKGQLREWLPSMFNEKELDRLMKLGGRVQVSLTIPFTDKKGKREKVEINQQFIENLLANVKSAEEAISKLEKKNLIIIVKSLKIPISTKANIQEVRSEIIKYLTFPDVWKDISS